MLVFYSYSSHEETRCGHSYISLKRDGFPTLFREPGTKPKNNMEEGNM
jgi:hypothetical protein